MTGSRCYASLGALVALGLAGCIEYGARRLDDDTPPVPDSDSPSEPLELCDGLDDDRDGDIDEGWPDEDSDSVADCLQCELAPKPAESGLPAAECATPSPSGNPWNIEEMWSYDAGFDTDGCRAVVADLDGDLLPEVLCASDRLHVLDGLTGEIEWSSDELTRFSALLAADVDADGEMDIVGVAPGGRLVALSSDGGQKWLSDAGLVPPATSLYYSVPPITLHAMRYDGRMAVVTPLGMVDGHTGETLELWPVEDMGEWRPVEVAVADVDLDGTPAVLTRWSSIDPDGTLQWTMAAPTGWEHGVTIMILQADADAEAETAWISDFELRVVDTDGSLMSETPLPTSTGHANGSLGCAGDLDGDGRMEIVFSDYDTLVARDGAGAIVWSVPITDSNTYLACTMFDLDGDGRLEVLHPDQTRFRIIDSDGVVRFSAMRASTTYHDVPIVADLDGDGSAEIIVTNPPSGSPPLDDVGLRVYTHATGGWAPAWPYWPHDGWSGAGLWPDGSIETDPAPTWGPGGVWRGQPAYRAWGSDLRPEIVDSCIAESEADAAEVRLAVRLANHGPQDARDGGAISVYVHAQDGTATLHEVLTWADSLPSGTTSESQEVVLTRSEARHGVTVTVGDATSTAPARYDCDESNDSASWSLP